ncbi:profilin [Mariannaea sp. PMI_226]|nr:profilin [Mariannaea sp. PMI_226]
MSWQAYIDTSLVGTGCIDKGAIISAAGDSVWASSPSFQPPVDEMKVIVSVLSDDSAAKDKVYADGLYICGERYIVARLEDGAIYARQGLNGIAIAKSKQAIVIGHHNETQVAGKARTTVEGLADYLVGVGY